MIKKYINKSLIILMGIFLFSFSSVRANEVDMDYSGEDIKQKVVKKSSMNEAPIESKIRDGVVMTKEEFNFYINNLNNKNKTTLLRVPNDGYVYVYNSMYLGENNKKDYYRHLGDFTAYNRTSSKMYVTYKQERTKTVTWDVASSISAKTTIGNDFLGKIEAQAGITVSRSSTTYSSTTLGSSVACLPKKKIVLTAYQDGVYAKAVTVYNKYHSSGGSAGVYTKTVSGTVVANNSFVIDAEETNIK